MRKAAYLALVGSVLASIGFHCDAGETAVFTKELEAVKQEVIEYDYPEFRARDFIPLEAGVDPAADVFKWFEFDRVGIAKMLANYADDIPNVSTYGKENTSPIEGHAIGFSYSVHDIRVSVKTGRSLESRLAIYAREAIERRIEKVAAHGDAVRNVPGFLNNSGVPLITAGINGDWNGAATPAQILEDLHTMAFSVWITSKQVHKPNTILLGSTLYRAAASTIYSDTTGETVLDAFLRTSTMIRSVEPWVELDLADAEGNQERAVVYDRNPRNLGLILPMEFQAYPPQARDLMFFVPCEGRIGGTVWYRPLAGGYVDGLNDA